MAHETVERTGTRCGCDHNAEFKVLPVGVKPRPGYGQEHKPNAWLCCGKCIVRVMRQKMYSSYIVRMVDD